MISEHDKEQDARIAANAEAVKLMVGYLRELRDHFEPISGMIEKASDKWPIWVRTLRLCAKLGVAAVVLVKVGGWYFNKQQLHNMADRYARVGIALYYSESNPDVALPFIDKAIEIESECPEFIFQRAYMKGMSATRRLLNLDRPLNKRELDEAHQAYAEALFLQGLDAKRPESYILQAQILSALKEKDRARAAVERAVQIDPASEFAHVRMALIQLDEKDVEGAAASLDRALELNPQSKWALLWKGVVASDYKKDFDAARDFYDKALTIDPKFDIAYYNRGWTFAKGKEKDYKRAREEMKKALQINPEYKEALYAMGMFYGYEDNYVVADVWMDKAIAVDEGFLSAWKWKGIICGEMGRHADAVRCFDAAIHLDPMNADLYVRRAKMFAAMERKDEARRDLNFALDLDAKGARTLLYLGNLEDDAEKAVAYYDRAIAANDKYDEAYAAKAKALARLGKKAEALAAIEQAIKVSTYKPERFEKIKSQIEAQ